MVEYENFLDWWSSNGALGMDMIEVGENPVTFRAENLGVPTAPNHTVNISVKEIGEHKNYQHSVDLLPGEARKLADQLHRYADSVEEKNDDLSQT